MIEIIADNKIPFLKGALEPYAAVRYVDGRDISGSTLEEAVAMLIRTRTVCNDSLLRGSRVRFIATATIGFDHIDTGYCNAHSINWTNAPGCNASSVQQYIASVLASLVIRNNYSLRGKTIGIVGVGHVGKEVKALARLLGMTVLLNDPPRARVEGQSGFLPLEEVLAGSDIVSLHVPLNRSGVDKSFHLLDQASLEFCKPGAWLINTSRGEVVDSDALKHALSDGRLSGAVLDVWEHEPEVDRQLLDLGAIATPHIAGYSTDGKRNATVQVVRSLGTHFNLPLTDWTPEAMPAPENPVIIVNCQEVPIEQLVSRVILHTCDVMDDDLRFRADPGDFEKLRGNYPVRREFPAYRIMMLNGTKEARDLFLTMGFTVIES